MAETKTKKRILTKGDVESPNASAIIGEAIAELPSVRADKVTVGTARQYDKKRTHKASEPKASPRSYRFGVSVEKRLNKAKRLLGVKNETVFVEGALIAAFRTLGV